ncbi:hypothetical protein PR048_009339 [Dryococelus australis]|uniref:Zinc finger BED domain-containing protein 5 n=1 Tax=Dryococelus australis TaxID=614101 RepID=A0ABQ9HZK6_9NEOP|nr:hypothetical protein PR048_009339 [Dryococelus australis]
MQVACVCLMELRAEVVAFLMEYSALLARVLNYEDWVCKLAYLADIFDKMNEMSISLKGKSATVFDTNAKVSSFKRKIMYWLECVVNEDTDCFALTKSFLDQNNIKIQEKKHNTIRTHLKALKDSFEYYFLSSQEKVIDDFGYIQNVFSVNKRPPSLNSAKYEVFKDFTSCSELKMAFQNQSLPDFWLHLQDEFKILYEQAKLALLPFSTTYLCEAGFSAYTATKRKYRSGLNAKPDIRLQLSSIKPEIRKLCKLMQPQESH